MPLPPGPKRRFVPIERLVIEVEHAGFATLLAALARSRLTGPHRSGVAGRRDRRVMRCHRLRLSGRQRMSWKATPELGKHCLGVGGPLLTPEFFDPREPLLRRLLFETLPDRRPIFRGGGFFPGLLRQHPGSPSVCGRSSSHRRRAALGGSRCLGGEFLAGTGRRPRGSGAIGYFRRVAERLGRWFGRRLRRYRRHGTLHCRRAGRAGRSALRGFAERRADTRILAWRSGSAAGPGLLILGRSHGRR